MSSDTSAEVLEKMTEWSDDDVRANIDNILPTLLSSLSSDDVGQKFQVVQALLTTCLPYMPVNEAEERLLQHAVPAAKQLFFDAIECIHASLEDGFLTQADSLGDKVGNFLEVCTTILKCLATILEYIATERFIGVSIIYSVPENIASILLKSFQHCKESQTLYGEQFTVVSELLSNFFRESHQVQVLFFNVIAENVQFNCFVEDELQLLVRVLEAIGDGGEILLCLEVKSMAEQWKGYTRLTQKYEASLKSHLDLEKPISVLVSEVERLLGEVIQAPLSDPKLTAKCLKLGNFLIKIILKLGEQFGGYLESCASFLLHLISTLHWHSSVSLSNSNLPDSVIEDIQKYLVVAADPLLSVVYTDYSFRSEFFNCCLRQTDSNSENGEIQRIPIVFIIAIIKQLIQCDLTQRSQWTNKDPTSNIFAAVFSAVKIGHEHLMDNEFIQMVVEQGSNPTARKMDLYGALVAHLGALVASAQAEEIEAIEIVLLENILQPNSRIALLASDVWIILARTESSKMCLDQILFLSDTLTSMIDARIECPEKRHLCSLLRRLVPLLSTQDKGLLAEKLHPKSHPVLWKEIGLKNLPEKNKTNATRDLVSSAQDSVAKFLGNGQVAQMIKGLETALALLQIDSQSISVSSLSSIWNTIPSNGCVLSPWLTTSETRNSVSCWLEDFLSTLCEATSHVVINMNNEQILQVLQRLRAATPHSSSVVKLNILKILRSLALKLFDNNPDQAKVCSEIARLFADILQDKNAIVCHSAIETFSYFSHVTRYEKIFIDTLSNSQKLKQMVTNYFQKTLPSTECTSEDGFQRFIHKCVYTEVPVLNSVSPPSKKLKYDDEIDFSLDGNFLGSDTFFEEELHSAVKKLTENCGDIVNYASANTIPEETINKLKTVVHDLQKVIVNKK